MECECCGCPMDEELVAQVGPVCNDCILVGDTAILNHETMLPDALAADTECVDDFPMADG